MDSNIAARFRAARSLIPNELIDAAGLAALSDVAQHLPGALSANYVLECRLGDVSRRADFSVRIGEPGNGHHVLAGYEPNAAIAPELVQQPIWQRITAFARDWADGSADLPDLSLWLEFDTATQNAAASSPSIFFQPGPRPRAPVNDARGHSAAPTGAWDPAMLERVLSRWPLPRTTTDNLAACFAAAPTPSGIVSLGLLLPRVPADARVTVSPLDVRTALAYLDALDWQGFGPDFDAFVECWPDFAAPLRLNLDIGETVGPRISVECCWSCPPSEFRADARWRAWLDRLITRGLARADKCRTLVGDFTYVEDSGDSDQPWPADLTALSHLFGATHRSLFWFLPLHVKLVHQAGRPLESKAYFSLVHFLTPRSTR